MRLKIGACVVLTMMGLGLAQNQVEVSGRIDRNTHYHRSVELTLEGEKLTIPLQPNLVYSKGTATTRDGCKVEVRVIPVVDQITIVQTCDDLVLTNSTLTDDGKFDLILIKKDRLKHYKEELHTVR